MSITDYSHYTQQATAVRLYTLPLHLHGVELMAVCFKNPMFVLLPFEWYITCTVSAYSKAIFVEYRYTIHIVLHILQLVIIRGTLYYELSLPLVRLRFVVLYIKLLYCLLYCPALPAKVCHISNQQWITSFRSFEEIVKIHDWVFDRYCDVVNFVDHGFKMALSIT